MVEYIKMTVDEKNEELRERYLDDSEGILICNKLGENKNE